MRSSLLCLAILLAVPCAHAEQGTSVLADASAAAAPALDLSFDPAVAAEEAAGPVLRPTQLRSAGGDAAAPFSVGVDIKTRRRDVRSPAAWVASGDEDEPPTLADKVEGIVERSTIGVTGTYRF